MNPFLPPSQSLGIESAYARSLHDFRMDLMEKLRSIPLTQLKAGVPHEVILPKATYAPWAADQRFLDIYKQIHPFTLVDKYRCFELYHLAGSLAGIPGDFIEVGVWRGGTGALLALQAGAIPEARVWLADTFRGVPMASSRDTLYTGGQHADTNARDVEVRLRSWGLEKFHILEGLFPMDTGHLLQSKAFRMVHIDVDTYESAKATFEFLWPRVSPRGIVIIDDFGFWGCEGVTEFVGELSRSGLSVIHNLNGHAILVK